MAKIFYVSSAVRLGLCTFLKPLPPGDQEQTAGSIYPAPFQHPVADSPSFFCKSRRCLKGFPTRARAQVKGKKNATAIRGFQETETLLELIRIARAASCLLVPETKEIIFAIPPNHSGIIPLVTLTLPCQ